MTKGIGCLNFINSNLININSSFNFSTNSNKNTSAYIAIPCWKQSMDWQKGTLMIGPCFDKRDDNVYVPNLIKEM